MNICDIKRLISLKQEGSYWDFKREWYSQDKKADLLHDIICMANNLSNRDGYIIIGIDEENDYSTFSLKDDINRKNTQQLVDFLRDKHFAGGVRPVVSVESNLFGENNLDVIVVHNSDETPFYLTDNYQSVMSNNIYTRVMDSNTPKNKSADISHIEMLWKKRFVRRYHTVTTAINREFWNSSSDTQNSLYVGSYGRGTAIDSSDLDILMILPEREYLRHDSLKENGQSRLLQSVRQAIMNTYPRSDIRADGQVVKIAFSDGMKFEILPAFKNADWYGNWDGTYKYPDSNMGGNWRSTNPKTEQDAMKSKNASSNGLLFDTCKHMRFVRDNYFSSYHLSGIVIDSFVYNAIGGWRWTPPGNGSSAASGTYEKVLLDYLNQNSVWGMLSLTAPGSGQSVSTESSLECLKKVINYIV